MKKTIFTIALLSVFVYACSSKKAGSTSSNSTEVTEAVVTAAKTKFPDANMDVLKKGHDLYYGTCTGCHGAKKIINLGADEIPSIVNRMAKKAKISDEEKDAVLKYMTGVKLAEAK